MSDSGIISTVAAGNFSKELKDPNKSFPAMYGLGFKSLKGYIPAIKNIKVVSNYCRNGKLCESSNFGKNVFKEIGESIYSTLPNDSYGTMTGTSQATPAHLHRLLKQKCIKIHKGENYEKR
jgi:hypothetical protein